jgi:hypothetical protein
MRRIGITLVVTQALLAGPALAEDVEGEREVVREADREIVKRRTHLDFNDTEIDGQLIGPEEDYIPGQGRIRFRNLIELRQDFHRELQTSVDSDF